MLYQNDEKRKRERERDRTTRTRSGKRRKDRGGWMYKTRRRNRTPQIDKVDEEGGSPPTGGEEEAGNDAQ